MRACRSLIVAAAAVVLIIGPDPYAAAATSQTEPYELGSYPTYWPQCYLNGARLRPSYGGACFLPPPGAGRVTVTINDRSGGRVAGRILFTTGYDEEQVGPVFCGSIADVPVPASTLGINVSTSPLRTMGACGLVTATSGTITARYDG